MTVGMFKVGSMLIYLSDLGIIFNVLSLCRLEKMSVFSSISTGGFLCCIVTLIVHSPQNKTCLTHEIRF